MPPYESIAFIPPNLSDASTENTLCDECAADRGRTPGLIRTEGTCYVCKTVGVVSETTYIAPLRRVRNGESVSTTPLQAALASAARSPERVARCPNCEAEIDHLRYSMPTFEYGTCNLDGEEYDSDGTEDNGDTTYGCPECDDDLNPDEVVYTDAPDESEDAELPAADCATKE
jgi:hypothetical protein